MNSPVFVLRSTAPRAPGSTLQTTRCKPPRSKARRSRGGPITTVRTALSNKAARCNGPLPNSGAAEQCRSPQFSQIETKFPSPPSPRRRAHARRLRRRIARPRPAARSLAAEHPEQRPRNLVGVVRRIGGALVVAVVEHDVVPLLPAGRHADAEPPRRGHGPEPEHRTARGADHRNDVAVSHRGVQLAALE